MVFPRLWSAFAAAALLSMASAQGSPTTNSAASSTVRTITTPSQTLAAHTFTEKGCFNSSAPLEDHGMYDAQSSGNCQLVCIWLNKPVMALSDGTNCWCGDLLPANDTYIDSKFCNTNCVGTRLDNCGGPKKLRVLLSGTTPNQIDYYVPPVVESSSTRIAAPSSSQRPQNSLETSTDPALPGNNSSGGSNKTAIAVGAVVGIVALLAIIGGVFFFLRQKRRREVEEEFRRQANMNSFTAGGKLHTSNSSMTDSRLDPEFMNRRQSNGSIADNEDYSRRILKVTNA